MKIERIRNPLTASYYNVKNLLLSSDFPWFWYNDSHDINEVRRLLPRVNIQDFDNVSFYGHVIVGRPLQNDSILKLLPTVRSNFMEPIYNLFIDTIKENNIKVHSIMRINANCVHGGNNTKFSIPHVDHEFDHTNMIFYFSNVGGATVLLNREDSSITDEYEPNEDDVITFKGLHCMRPSAFGRRIILIFTYI